MTDSEWVRKMRRNKFVNTWQSEDYEEYGGNGRCQICDTLRNLLFITCDLDHPFVACQECARMCDTCTTTRCISHRGYGDGFGKCPRCDAKVCEDCLNPDSLSRTLGLRRHRCKRKNVLAFAEKRTGAVAVANTTSDSEE